MNGLPEEGDAYKSTVSIYQAARVALLTQHGKEGVIGAALEAVLGCRVERVDGFDTDRLGTFTRDIPRAGTQLDAARRKARLGMELSGLPLGIASEGAFGPDPFMGMLPWNVEILIWIDDVLGIEVVGSAAGAAIFEHRQVACLEQAEDFARTVRFPSHGLVVRPDDEHHVEFKKGVSDWDTFREAVNWALERSQHRRAFLETDVRAHLNPTRMGNIRLAAEDLARKLTSLCPACGAPGFTIVKHEPGLPCEYCDAPTRETLADLYQCVRCGHGLRVERSGGYAAAGCCDLCNP